MNPLRIARARSGLSVRELAAKAKVSGRNISFIENDKQKATFKTLVLLADALGVDVQTFEPLLDKTASERGKKGQAVKKAKAAGELIATAN